MSKVVSIVIDASGSMREKRGAAGLKISQAQQAAEDFVNDNVSDDDYLGVRAFNTQVIDLAPVAKATIKHTKRCIDKLYSLNPNGGTALWDAMVVSLDELAGADPNLERVLIVLTDGEDNASNYTCPEVMEHARTLGIKNLRVFIIGIGFVDDPCLKQFPYHFGGEYIPVEEGRIGEGFESVGQKISGADRINCYEYYRDYLRGQGIESSILVHNAGKDGKHEVTLPICGQIDVNELAIALDDLIRLVRGGKNIVGKIVIFDGDLPEWARKLAGREEDIKIRKISQVDLVRSSLKGRVVREKFRGRITGPIAGKVNQIPGIPSDICREILVIIPEQVSGESRKSIEQFDSRNDVDPCQHSRSVINYFELCNNITKHVFFFWSSEKIRNDYINLPCWCNVLQLLDQKRSIVVEHIISKK